MVGGDGWVGGGHGGWGTGWVVGMVGGVVSGWWGIVGMVVEMVGGR